MMRSPGRAGWRPSATVLLVRPSFILVVIALLGLTACGTNGAEPGPSPTSVTTAPTVTDPAATQEMPERIDVLEPDSTPPVQTTNGDDEPRTVSGRDRLPASSDPEPEKRNPVQTGDLPEGFDIPKGSELFEPASKLDGDRSILVLMFDSTWQESADRIRRELEDGGWECFSCLPFEGRGDSTGTAAWRYLLNMQQGDRKLIAVVSERPSGSQVDINFAASS
jgi:hypothetical protein